MKFLTAKVNTFTLKIVFIIVLILGLKFLISGIIVYDLMDILTGISALIVAYLTTIFNIIKYDSCKIWVINLIGEECRDKKDVLSITPLRDYINIFYLNFKNGDKFLFTIGSNKFIFSENAKNNAQDLEKMINEA